MGTTEIKFLQEIFKRGGRKGDRVLRYYRRAGVQWGSLRGAPGSAEFAEDYARLHALAERELAPPAPSIGHPPGSIGHTLKLYYASGEFTSLGERTQSDYKRYLDPISTRYGHLAIASLDRPREVGQEWKGRVWVKRLRDAWKKTPFHANYRIACLRLLFNFAVELNLLGHNPAAKPRRHKVEARVVMWSWEEQDHWLATVDQALAPAAIAGERRARSGRPALQGTQSPRTGDVVASAELLRRAVRRGFFLLAYTAQRPGDVLNMPWTRYDPDKVVTLPDGRTVVGTIKLKQAKRGKLVEVPVHPDLKAELDAWHDEDRARGLLMLLTPEAQAFTMRYFARWWDMVSRAAGIADRRRADLRGTAATRMAEGGATIPQIASVTGWSIQRTTEIVEDYLVRSPVLAAGGIIAITRPPKQQEGA